MGASTVREALEAAWEAGGEGAEDAEPTPGDTEDTAATPPPTTPAEGRESAQEAGGKPAPDVGGRPRDDGGRFAKAPRPKGKALAAEAKAAVEEKPAAAAPPVAEGTPVQTSALPGTGGAEALKPPPSWKPMAREKWAQVPAEVQQEVLRVDQEVRQVMQRAATERQQADGQRRVLEAVQRTIQPFEGMIRAEGAEPLQAIGTLLQTAHALRTAPMARRAQLVAGIIQSHGIPVEMLADALEGKAPAAGQGQGGAQQAPVDAAAIARQVREEVQQDLQRQELGRLKTQARADMNAFFAGPGKEFGETVRELMADLMELRGRAGKALTYEEAYQEAVRFHPDVAPVLQQRAEVEAARKKAPVTQRARAAASSVKTEPSGAPPAGKPAGLRGAIEQAWSDAERE